MEAKVIQMTPSDTTVDQFKEDLRWARTQVLQRSESLIGMNGKQFKLRAIQICFEIWDEGKKNGVFQESSIPVLSFDETNHTYDVSYKMVKIHSTCHLKVILKKQWGDWLVRAH